MHRLEQKVPLPMQKSICINMDYYLRSFLIVSAICLLGFTGCSSVGASAAKELHTALITKTDPHRTIRIRTTVNNSEDRVS
jgi:hypothetical protein